MQSNKIHKLFQWVSLFSIYVSSTCFGPHRSIIRSVFYKLYSQIWYVVIRVLLDTSSRNGWTCRVVGRSFGKPGRRWLGYVENDLNEMCVRGWAKYLLVETSGNWSCRRPSPCLHGPYSQYRKRSEDATALPQGQATGGWVGSRDNMYGCGRENIYCPVKDEKV